MNKGKWILAGILIIGIFFLVRDGFLSACGLDLTKNAKANFFLAAAIAGFVITGLLVAEKYKGWVSLFPIICLLTLLAIGIGSCNANHKEKKEARNEKIRNQIIDRVADKIADKIEGRVTQELGLPQEKSGSKNQGNCVRIPPPGQKPGKKIQKNKSIYDGWGWKSATWQPQKKK